MGGLRRTATDHEAAGFSRLEATFSQAKVLPRKNSIEMKDTYRHAQAADLEAKDLDFNFWLEGGNYPLDSLGSLQDVFAAVQHDLHLKNPRNFSDETRIRAFDVNGDTAAWHDLDSKSLSELLQNITTPPALNTLSAGSKHRRLLAFFVPSVPEKDTSFASRITMTQDSTMELFASLEIEPSFIMNLLGRPDYWAPRTRWTSDSNGNLVSCDFFCQHPRWNLHFQGAPLSVCVRYNAALDLTTYIISHKENDSSIEALQNILTLAIRTARPDRTASVFLDDPFDIAVILSTLSLEASKHHASRFRRFMWTQINKVDDHLLGLDTNDRRKLGELTKQLQIISQNADSHLGNADVAIITATAIRTAHARLHQALGSPDCVHERAADSITYVIDSMEKQKIWFLNYKNRKDSTMALVYNLVTQQDAASNIQLAASMKRDSTSMNAIAALTMLFLPGTFTATLFSATSDCEIIREGRIWWIWAVTTVPLTLMVMTSWYIYKKQKRKVPVTKVESDVPRRRARSIGFRLFPIRSRCEKVTGDV